MVNFERRDKCSNNVSLEIFFCVAFFVSDVSRSQSKKNLEDFRAVQDFIEGQEFPYSKLHSEACGSKSRAS